MKHPPYQLRPNKAVDRLLFAELLLRLGPHFSGKKITYYGFGGPFLEDLRLINQYCPQFNFVSIEENAETYKRQGFHRFRRDVNLQPMKLTTFMAEGYSPGELDIFWLDFTGMKRAFIEQFENVLQRVPCGSIVKVTLCTSPLGNVAEEKQFREKFAEWEPSDLSPKRFRKAGRPLLLQDMLKIASQRQVSSLTGIHYHILHSCYYSDGSDQMFCLTGAVGESDLSTELSSYLEGWEYRNTKWAAPHKIEMPVLSIKERLHLAALIPTAKAGSEELLDSLGYLIDDDKEASLDQLNQYATFCRQYPQFAKLQV